MPLVAEKQILVKLDEDTHAALIARAKAEGRSMHMQARRLIEDGLGGPAEPLPLPLRTGTVITPPARDVPTNFKKGKR